MRRDGEMRRDRERERDSTVYGICTQNTTRNQK
jgi:hypothetical protein